MTAVRAAVAYSTSAAAAVRADSAAAPTERWTAAEVALSIVGAEIVEMAYATPGEEEWQEWEEEEFLA